MHGVFFTQSGKGNFQTNKKETTDEHSVETFIKRRSYNNSNYSEHQQENKRYFLSFHTWCSKRNWTRKKGDFLVAFFFTSQMIFLFPSQASCLYDDSFSSLTDRITYNIFLNTYMVTLNRCWMGRNFFIVLFPPSIPTYTQKLCTYFYISAKKEQKKVVMRETFKTLNAVSWVPLKFSLNFSVVASCMLYIGCNCAQKYLCNWYRDLLSVTKVPTCLWKLSLC